MQENVKTNSYGTGNVNSKISYFRDSAILDFGTQSFSRVCKVFFHLSSTAATTLRAYDLAMAYVQGRYCKKTGLKNSGRTRYFLSRKWLPIFSQNPRTSPPFDRGQSSAQIPLHFNTGKTVCSRHETPPC